VAAILPDGVAGEVCADREREGGGGEATATPTFSPGGAEAPTARADSFCAANGPDTVAAAVEVPNDELGGGEEDGVPEFGSWPLGKGARGSCDGDVAGDGVGVGGGDGSETCEIGSAGPGEDEGADDAPGVEATGFSGPTTVAGEAKFSDKDTVGGNGPLARARCTALVSAPDKNGFGRASTTLG